jgi:hypothetical protein
MGHKPGITNTTAFPIINPRSLSFNAGTNRPTCAHSVVSGIAPPELPQKGYEPTAVKWWLKNTLVRDADLLLILHSV